MDKLNGDVINSFLTSLIRTNTKIKAETVTPLLPHILSNISKAGERHIFMKYILADDFLDNDTVFWSINFRNVHWLLLVIYPKLEKETYFDSLLSVTIVKQTLAPIFQYIKCYSQRRKIQIKWKVYVHSLIPRQSNDIDCGVHQQKKNKLPSAYQTLRMTAPVQFVRTRLKVRITNMEPKLVKLYKYQL